MRVLDIFIQWVQRPDGVLHVVRPFAACNPSAPRRGRSVSGSIPIPDPVLVRASGDFGPVHVFDVVCPCDLALLGVLFPWSEFERNVSFLSCFAFWWLVKRNKYSPMSKKTPLA